MGGVVSPQEIQLQRNIAKDLRATQWWKQEVAKGVCYYCKGQFPPDELTMDHVIPVSRGGKSDRHNVVPACKKCNNEKKYLTPAEIALASLPPVEDVDDEFCFDELE